VTEASETLNQATWNELRGSDPVEFRMLVESLLDLFRAEIPPLLQAIAETAGSGDAGAMAKAAHGVKGCAANLGAMRMAELSANLERIGRAGGCEGSRRLLKELQLEYHQVVQALEAQAASGA
jgi:HPt (histidine-containing phosphotransfer) domain-containing protein